MRTKMRLDLSNSILDYFNVDISIHQNELSRIPSYGKAVIIANHPLGALDALALVHVLKDIRKDIKIVASNFLGAFDNLKEILIPIENVKGKLTKNSVEAIYESLKKQEAVIIFPSGEVSRARPSGIKDTKWRSGFLKVAQKMQALSYLSIYMPRTQRTFISSQCSTNRSLRQSSPMRCLNTMIKQSPFASAKRSF